jgi:SHS2 domain-containing protein
VKSSSPAGFEELPNTADRALRVWAPDLAALFAEAARGMNTLMGVQLSTGPRTVRVYEAQASDPEIMLVAFLSELLYAIESEQLAFDTFKINLENDHLHVDMSGASFESLTGFIKAVTYHNLSIQRTKDKYQVEIVFDV